MKNTYFIASWAEGKNEGITKLVYDPTINKVYSKEIINNNKRSSYFARYDNNLFVLTEAKMDIPNQGLITFYKIDNHNLKYITKSNPIDSGIAHLALSADNKHLYASGYGTGSLTIIDIKDNNLINERIAFHNERSSIDSSRQTSSHMHFSIPSPDSDYVLTCDLGADEVLIFRVNKENGDFQLMQSVKVPSGYGPRHMIFSKDGKYAYILCEMSYHLLVYTYNNGLMNLVNDIDLIPGCPKEERACSAIKISNDGNILFTGNRGKTQASIDAFNITDPANPKKIDSYKEVSFPRDFTLLNDGYIAVCNQYENNIEFIRFADNKFTKIGKIEGIELPVSIIQE